MSRERARAIDLNPRMQRALDDLKRMIQQKYPTAAFEVSVGDDPEGVYLTPIVDVEDTEEVFDVVVGRLLELQIEEKLPLYVVPVRPIERVLEEMRAQQAKRPYWVGRGVSS